MSAGKSDWREWAKNIAGVAAALVALYVALGLAADLAAWSLPDAKEAAWFSWTAPGDTQGGAAFERAQALFGRLTAAGGLRELPYRLHRSDDSTPNAFALPGGAVVVTQGLLDKVQTETGLAFVLAHELGHHQHRHCLKRLGRTLLHKAAFAALFGSDSGVVGSAVDAASAGYSRDQEREADTFAFERVRQTLGHVDGCTELFEVLQADGHRSSKLDLFATHPVTEERIARLRALEREAAAQTPPATPPGD